MNKLKPIGASFVKTALPKFLLAASLLAGGTAAYAAPPGEGILEWDDGTSDFIDPATGVRVQPGQVVGDKFTTTFSPAALGGEAASFFSFGDFKPYFNTPPGDFFLVNGGAGAPATFNFIGLVGGGVGPCAFDVGCVYELENDLIFEFTTDLAPETVTASLAAGTDFAVLFEIDGAIEGDLLDTVIPPAISPTSQEWEFTFSGGPTTGTVLASSSAFEFGITENAPFGEYAAEGEYAHVSVPGPLPIFGAGVAFGFSRKLRRRIKSRVTA